MSSGGLLLHEMRVALHLSGDVLHLFKASA